MDSIRSITPFQPYKASPPPHLACELCPHSRMEETAIWYLEQVNRIEIIAAIDAEIERLQHARLLIAHSAIKKPSTDSHQKLPRVARVGQKQAPARARRSIPQPSDTAPTVIDQQPQIFITRLPPKEAPKRRMASIPTKRWTAPALTGNVPQGPVAAVSRSQEKAVGAADGTVAPTSAFGLAITRRLASI